VDAIAGKVVLESLLKGKMMSILFQRKGGYAVQPAVHFDNDFSKGATILEIVALDAFGLLYRIASVISSHGCNIEVALISTEGQRAIDVFYLTHNGQKIPHELELKISNDLNQMMVQA
jgi:[protein-PII] uridylyltransferase